MNFLFSSSFYTQHRAPNAEELIDIIDSYSRDKIDNSHFSWGKRCDVDRIPLRWQDFIDLLKPSIDLFGKEIKAAFDYVMYDPWISLYKRGQHQEIHEHGDNDISAVFFANSGKGFSDFYFQDRNSVFLSKRVKELIKYNAVYLPKVNAGDIIFFPSNLMHGVSPHNSDIIRKTLAINFTIK